MVVYIVSKSGNKFNPGPNSGIITTNKKGKL